MDTFIDGVDYGPLTQLVGRWVGHRGLDVAPNDNAENEQNPYSDELIFSVGGAATNAAEQHVVCLQYRHVVRRLATGLIFHDQLGHWIYEPATGGVAHSITLPRSLCVLAGGTVEIEDGKSIFHVEAKAGSETYGIIQSPFMLEKAKTTAFKMTMTVLGNKLNYRETTSLQIYGKEFEHTDISTLQKETYDME